MNELELKKKWYEQEVAILKLLEIIDDMEKKVRELEMKKSRKRGV